MHVAYGKFSYVTKRFCIDSGTRSQEKQAVWV